MPKAASPAKASMAAALSIGLLAFPFAALPAGAANTQPEPRPPAPAAGGTHELNLLGINDFHGRIDTNTVKFAGTVEQLRAENPEGTLFTSAGDNIGASLFASAAQDDQPTIDVLDALGLATSAVGNHEFDQGYEDLTGDVISGPDPAGFVYLGANVYEKGTRTPALDEYELAEAGGLTVGIIGVVTEDTRTLVSPGGISGIDFGDPVEAVNRVAAELSDGEGDEADIIVASYHEGASTSANLGTATAASPVFERIVNETSPEVDAIFNGHTHLGYAFDAPIPGSDETRPVVQTGQYGENVGRIQLTVTEGAEGGEPTFDVTDYSMDIVKRSTADDAALTETYPRVAEVKEIVDAALAEAKAVGAQPVGSVTADITTAFADGKRDDRASESTLGNLVADSLADTLSPEELGGAEIGVVNPGGLRSELYYVDDPALDDDGRRDGEVSYGEANAVLPFVNNLWTTTLTGAQFKTLLEQQWQLTADGEVPSRPYLHLGLSDNVSYTYDADAGQGSHVTGVWIDGQQLDPEREYRIGTFSFLAQGGDNFHVFADAANTRDSGLVDRDAWISYLEKNSPLAPSFKRRAAAVSGVPAAVEPGQDVSFRVSKLDLTSLGAPENKTLTLRYEPADSGASAFSRAVTAAALPAELGTFDVADGGATVSFTVPSELRGGAFTLTAAPSGTLVRLPIEVPTAGLPDEDGGQPGGEQPTDQPGGEHSTGQPQPGGGEPTSVPTTSPLDGGTAGPDASAPAAPADGSLPFTGASGLLPLGIGALVLIGGGTAAVLAVRRRKQAGR